LPIFRYLEYSDWQISAQYRPACPRHCKEKKTENLVKKIVIRIVLLNISFFHVQEVFKGSVRRKLRWVKNNVECWVLAWNNGTGIFFVIFILQLVMNTFPVNMAQLKFN
jgi:hypothetical protein